VGAPPLDHVLRHNVWATGALIEFCRTLDPARLDASAPGTYGTLYGTLQHLVGGEQWLATIAAATGARLLRVAASDDATRVIVTDEPYRSTVGVVLAQVVHHGNEHRTQATTILGANGIEPPSLSAWLCGRATGVSKHDAA
jgi:uncharacterized damage-inducible protein DinB